MVAGALESGDLRIALRQRLRCGGAMAGGLSLHRQAHLGAPGLHALRPRMGHGVMEPGGSPKESDKEGGQNRPPAVRPPHVTR